MKVIHFGTPDRAAQCRDGLWDIEPLSRPTVFTFGVFDGLHLGHQALLRHALDKARATGRDAGILFFHPNPLKVIAPERCPPMLLSLPKKLAVLESFGMDIAVVAHFDDELRRTEPEAFLELLREKLRVEALIVGYDSRFGYRGRGDIHLLIEEGKRLGFEVDALPAQSGAGGIVSATRIRHAVGEGELTLAAELLGRPYSVGGRVVEGDKRGRLLGFPTANVDTGDYQLPPLGIYAGRVHVGGAVYGAAVSLGVRPTFDGKTVRLEAFLLDFSGDLYNQELEVVFVEKLRDELRFDHVDVLIAQMHRDVDKTREILEMGGSAR